MFDVKKILCPIDFSEASLEAFDVAKSVAAKFDATILALHVAMTPPEYSDWAAVLPVDEEDLAERSEELAKLRREDGGRFDRLVRVGDAESTIVREAKDRGCDLIVMGTAGRGGVGRLLLGSVAEHVSRKAHCPVLLVRAHAAAAAAKAESKAEAVA